ncbi:MAG: glutamine--fructose-6-phosphate transaminase (isomerizing) [Planctomycetaceae bacterium]|jgi:glucosamine--fructose-6-phosphate aminotransferase (isomerizing)|nr:glutamine--fructose-6-phosphate transaminase (isomerizing) [Planctomycetaceae bacterium]
MCGIVGCVGQASPVDFLLRGLRRLEYRGYDSAGIAVNDELKIEIAKTPGRISVLQELVSSTNFGGSSCGIGHTRWATHGAPTHENAHPHLSANGSVAVVHNGVIENYQILRDRLIKRGVTFNSQTDSEAIAHLIEYELPRDLTLEKVLSENYMPLVDAVRRVLVQLRGTYGLVVLFRDYHDLLIGARLGSPLVVGISGDAHFIASDVAPLAGYAEKIVYLSDKDIVVLTPCKQIILHSDEGEVERSPEVLDIRPGDTERGEFAHHMLKEIFEQPETIRAALRGRLDHDSATAKFGGLNLSPEQMRRIQRIMMTACGTSWHASLVAEHQIESLARIPVEVEYASELRYRNPPIDDATLLFAITQSGETADTLAAMREMQRRGFPTLAICNVVGSTIAREADGGIFLHAGIEVGVASTKAFTSQCTVMALLALYFGRLRHLSYEMGKSIINELEQLPTQIEDALSTSDSIRQVAEKYADCTNFLYLGRQYNFPTALEGALKLKEISYIHAEGYPAAEMKHGPIALVDKQTPSVFIVPKHSVQEKTLSNIQEVKARGGPVIALCCKGDKRVLEMADDCIELPEVAGYLQPIVYSVPLQLFAYHIAVQRGCDVDKPRNLAKSVTVE